MVVGFYWNLMLGCWVWILRALAQFKGSERSSGLLHYHCIALLIALSQFWVSLDYLWFYCTVTFLINAVSSDVILLEFINWVSAVSLNIGMANPPYLFDRKIATLSLSLHMWHLVTAGINLFLIVFSRSSSKWWMFGKVLRK